MNINTDLLTWEVLLGNIETALRDAAIYAVSNWWTQTLLIVFLVVWVAALVRDGRKFSDDEDPFANMDWEAAAINTKGRANHFRR